MKKLIAGHKGSWQAKKSPKRDLATNQPNATFHAKKLVPGLKGFRASGLQGFRAYGLTGLRAYGLKGLRAYGLKGLRA